MSRGGYIVFFEKNEVARRASNEVPAAMMLASQMKAQTPPLYIIDFLLSIWYNGITT